MDPDFGERQFETAVNIELTAGLRAYMAPAIPIVPTTNQEAEAGWDALYKLGAGYWYYLQFKVATLATRRTGRNKAFWDFHRGPYLRFSLHTNSSQECRQHRLLGDLRRTQPGVYYCAPGFVTEGEFWDRADNGTVLAGSRLIDLADVPLTDYYGRHQISYDDSGLVRTWSEAGEPTRGERSPEIRRRQGNRREVRAEAVAELLADAMRTVAGGTGRRRDASAIDAWIGARMPEQTRNLFREAWREPESEGLVPALTQLVSPGELLAVTSRILRLDFGLSWFVEP